jgi:hypothetical protein
MARAATITKNNPRDLRLVTAGQGISLIGDSINQLALPLMAVDLLNADSFGTGALGAASTLAYLFIGLQAGVWTSDINKAHGVARALRAGTVHVNQYDEDDITVPFGGYKQSGVGRDKSLHAFDKYTETKTTWIRIDSPV